MKCVLCDFLIFGYFLGFKDSAEETGGGAFGGKELWRIFGPKREEDNKFTQ
jgi:hypothetical protein